VTTIAIVSFIAGIAIGFGYYYLEYLRSRNG
jgi:hypothetical protein